MSALRLEIEPFVPPKSLERDFNLNKLWETVQYRAEKLFLPFDANVWNTPKPAISRTTGYAAQYRGGSVVRVGLNHLKVPDSIREKMGDEDFGIYSVNIVKHTCDCPCFEKNKLCKHLSGLLIWLKKYDYTISPKGYIKWNYEQ